MAVKKVMMAATVIVLLVSAAVYADDVTDEPLSCLADWQYHSMPPLFALDDWPSCLAAPDGHFCLGSFRLAPAESADEKALALFDQMRRYSLDQYHYNHTLVHRGYCVSRRCVNIAGGSPRRRFERCVDAHTRDQYGLKASLTQLECCRRSGTPPPPYDAAELAFAAAVALILLANLLGTVYDLLRNSDKKPSFGAQLLLAWSVRNSWRRLTARYEDGDPRLAAMAPVHGIRVITLLVVMLAHTIIANEMSYLSNPEYVEKAKLHPLTMLLYNGSVVVQGFVLVSGFLLVYHLLLLAESRPDKPLTLRLLPYVILHRVIRILPVYMFSVGLAATWWARASDGPQWGPLIDAEAARCRRKWWTHLFFINNFVQPDTKCLIQSWFLAVDMQLHIFLGTLALLVARRRWAVAAFSVLLVAAVAGNYTLALLWDLKPISMVMNPEVMRRQYSGCASFEWLYAAPWGSLPAALLGGLYAVLHRRMQLDKYDVTSNRVLMWIYRGFLPLLLLWILGGHLVSHRSGPHAVALYAAVDRLGYSAIAVFALLGFFHNVDSIWRRIFAWDGWRVASRVALPALALHWHFTLMQRATSPDMARMAVLDIAGQLYHTIILTYAAAIPLYLLLEAPAQRFLHTIFFCFGP